MIPPLTRSDGVATASASLSVGVALATTIVTIAITRGSRRVQPSQRWKAAACASAVVLVSLGLVILQLTDKFPGNLSKLTDLWIDAAALLIMMVAALTRPYRAEITNILAFLSCSALAVVGAYFTVALMTTAEADDLLQQEALGLALSGLLLIVSLLLWGTIVWITETPQCIEAGPSPVQPRSFPKTTSRYLGWLRIPMAVLVAILVVRCRAGQAPNR